MEKVKLNKDMGQVVLAHGYELDPTKEYVIDFQEEFEKQTAIMMAVQTMGLPAMKDYHNWLRTNGFDAVQPNPTNEFVSKYYGF